MSKSVAAHDTGLIVSATNRPTRCRQQCSLVVATVRGPRDLTELSAKSPQSADEAIQRSEGRRGQPAPGISLPRRCSDRRPAADDRRPMTRSHRSSPRPPLAWPPTSGSSVAGEPHRRGQCDGHDRDDLGGPGGHASTTTSCHRRRAPRCRLQLSVAAPKTRQGR